MGLQKYRDIEIRGVVYSDAVTAARKLNVKPDTVRLAARTGNLDKVGLGIRIVPTPVRIAGRDFPSARAAAKAYGKTPQAVWKAIDEGDPDRIARPPRKARTGCKPVTIGPLSFPSMREASVQLGFGPDYISHALRRGSKHAQQRLLAAAMRLAAERDQDRRTAA